MSTPYEYSDFTLGLFDAILAGDICDDCGVPNHIRHFDECPQHPDNLKADTHE